MGESRQDAIARLTAERDAASAHATTLADAVCKALRLLAFTHSVNGLADAGDAKARLKEIRAAQRRYLRWRFPGATKVR